MSNQELAVRGNTAVALVDIAEDSGAGFEKATVDSYAIPFLALLQSGSPQCKRSDGAYIEGASEGMLLDTVTNEVIDVFKKPVKLVLVSYKEALVEWKLREAGGGFVQEHPVIYKPALVRDEKNRDILPNGNQLVNTATFYILRVRDDGLTLPMSLTLTGTQRKKARKLMTQLQTGVIRDGKLLRPAMYWRVWDATTVAESNDKGSWFGWNFKEAGYTLDDQVLYDAAKEFYKAISKGIVQEATETLRPSSDAADTSGAAF